MPEDLDVDLSETTSVSVGQPPRRTTDRCDGPAGSRRRQARRLVGVEFNAPPDTV